MQEIEMIDVFIQTELYFEIRPSYTTGREFRREQNRYLTS